MHKINKTNTNVFNVSILIHQAFMVLLTNNMYFIAFMIFEAFQYIQFSKL